MGAALGLGHHGKRGLEQSSRDQVGSTVPPPRFGIRHGSERFFVSLPAGFSKLRVKKQLPKLSGFSVCFQLAICVPTRGAGNGKGLSGVPASDRPVMFDGANPRENSEKMRTTVLRYVAGGSRVGSAVNTSPGRH